MQWSDCLRTTVRLLFRVSKMFWQSLGQWFIKMICVLLSGFMTQQAEVIVNMMVKTTNSNMDVTYGDMATKTQQVRFVLSFHAVVTTYWFSSCIQLLLPVVVYTTSLIAEPRSNRSVILLDYFCFTGNHVTESHVSYHRCEKGHDHSWEEWILSIIGRQWGETSYLLSDYLLSIIIIITHSICILALFVSLGSVNFFLNIFWKKSLIYFYLLH